MTKGHNRCPYCGYAISKHENKQSHIAKCMSRGKGKSAKIRQQWKEEQHWK